MRQPPAGTVNNAVNFTTPAGTTAVTPTLSDSSSAFWRAADVTSLVQAGVDIQPNNGQYITGAVPSRNNPNGRIIGTSWGLIVVYENTSLPFRYFNINTGIAFVSSSTQAIFNFTDFITPSSGPVSGFLLMNYVFGDLIDAAQVRVGETAGSAVQIGNTSNPWDGQSPYSRINNMFPGNVLIADTNDPNIGLLDTRGTFGNLNINPYASTAPVAARNIYDITGLDISNTLVNSQQSFYTNVTFAGSGSADILSESVQIDLNAPNITINKTVDTAFADIGDILNYTITLTNTGSLNADNLVVIDTIPNGTSFISDSIFVNGTNLPDANLENGINIGTVVPNQVILINFSLRVDSLPTPNPISNIATIQYSFLILPNQPIINVEEQSNPTDTQVNHTEITLVKTVDTDVARVGDVLTYTIIMTASGNVTATNVVFTDPPPNGTEFIPGSVTVDGAIDSNADPAVGINLGDIAPGESVTVSFMVQFTSQLCCLAIRNVSSVTFEYEVTPGLPPENGSSQSNSILTKPALRNFKQINIDSKLTIPKSNPDIEDILNVTIIPENVNTYRIETIPLVSIEGETLTNYKLIIDGRLNIAVEYIENTAEQSVHATEYSMPFNTFIILPQGIDPDYDANINFDVEDIFYTILNEKTIFTSAVVLVKVTFSN